MSNPTSKIAKQIFEKWDADLSTKDRGWNNVYKNFDELFYEMWSATTPFDEAHDYIVQAIKSHLPNSSIAKRVYDAQKNKEATYQEFLDKWKKGISGFAYQAFYVYFKPQSEEAEKEKKAFGNMTEKEYKQQRAYAESFNVLDTRNLQKKMAEGTLETLDDYLDALGFDPESKDGN